MNEKRLRSRHEGDEFGKRFSKRFCSGIFIKDKDTNKLKDEPTAPLDLSTAYDDNKDSTATANKDSTATAKRVSTATAKRVSTATAKRDSTATAKRDSTTTANKDSTTTANKDSTTTANKDSTTTANKDSTAIANKDSTAIANKDSTTTANKDSTTNANKDSTTTANKDSTATANKDSTTIANKDSTATANKDSTATANKDSTTTANKDSTATANKDSTATANKDSTTTANKDSTATAKRDSTATANKDSTTTANKDSTATANKDSTATANKDSTTTANKDSTTTANKDSTATANKDSTATANKDSTATANKDSTATANKDSTATANKDSTATAKRDSTATAKRDSTTTANRDSTATATRDSTATANKDSTATANKDSTTSSSEPNCSIIPGAVVWALYGRKPSRYIGIVIPSIPRVQINSPHYRNVYWFGENTISKIPAKNINHFLDLEVYEEINEVPMRAVGIPEAVQVICDQHTLLDDIPKPRTLDEFISWIKKETFSQCDYTIPSAISKQVEAINNKGIVIDPEDGPSRAVENVQITDFAVDFEDRDPTTMCLGCREVTSRKEPHPLVKGFLCRNCYMRVMENYMVLRMNQKYFRYCSICGWLDKYVFCKTCKRVICRTCVMFWFEEEAYKTAAQYAFRWTCLFCVQPGDSPVYNTKLLALHVNANAQVCSVAFEETQWPQQSEVNLLGKEDEKPALRVLSLFDGICTGMLALSNLGIKVEKYFASEIDSDAVMVTRCKFGDSVEQIGDVKDITSESIKKYLPIHLLIGGSPCNDLSRVNHCRKGLTDLNGSGSLFFEFYRVMKLIDDSQGHPRTYFYLFENVSSMEAMHKNTMSRFFESPPICIDAKFMAAMSRPRFFWGNIPQMGTLAKEYLLNARDCQQSNLQDHLTPNLRRRATVNKIRTVTTISNSLTKSDGSPQVMMAGEASTLSVTEIEKIFGFPEHYTDVMNLTPNVRRKLLGKAWCVHVIQALFKPLAELFQGEGGEDPLVECVLGE